MGNEGVIEGAEKEGVFPRNEQEMARKPLAHMHRFSPLTREGEEPKEGRAGGTR